MTAALVVIGASLGGVEAIRIVAARLPDTVHAALVLVLHRRGGYADRMSALLRPDVRLPVRDVESDDAQLEAGSLYVAPPDYHTLFARGRLSLSTEASVHNARPSIDVAFESAAEAYGAALLAVLLTCASHDGAEGLAVARRAGATTVVQDPATAESDVALREALARDRRHEVLSLEAIADRIAAWGTRAPSRPR